MFFTFYFLQQAQIEKKRKSSRRHDDNLWSINFGQSLFSTLIPFFALSIQSCDDFFLLSGREKHEVGGGGKQVGGKVTRRVNSLTEPLHILLHLMSLDIWKPRA